MKEWSITRAARLRNERQEERRSAACNRKLGERLEAHGMRQERGEHLKKRMNNANSGSDVIPCQFEERGEARVR